MDTTSMACTSSTDLWTPKGMSLHCKLRCGDLITDARGMQYIDGGHD